jgi:hypothetical protein
MANWATQGNNINANNDWLGTTNNQPLVIRTNNTERMRVTPDGRIIVAQNLNAGPSSIISASGSSTDGIIGAASGSSIGVEGISDTASGVLGYSGSGVGVEGYSGGIGVQGTSTSGPGVLGISGYGTGVYGLRTDPAGVAGFFDGGVTVANGDLTVINGNKPFKIDHPLDPQNKYLLHNAVESSERKNVYDGVAQLDEDGEAWVELPEWFEALNGDLRYQLTAIGGPAPNLHVAEELSENRFRIAGGQEGMKVCWQLTGSRKDSWAAANIRSRSSKRSPRRNEDATWNPVFTMRPKSRGSW